MYIRRYYRRGITKDKSLTEDYFRLLVEQKGLDYALSQDTANLEFIFESKQERDDYVQASYWRVINDPAFYLEHLEEIPTFNKSGKIYDYDIFCYNLEGAFINKPKDL